MVPLLTLGVGPARVDHHGLGRGPLLGRDAVPEAADVVAVLAQLDQPASFGAAIGIGAVRLASVGTLLRRLGAAAFFAASDE